MAATHAALAVAFVFVTRCSASHESPTRRSRRLFEPGQPGRVEDLVDTHTRNVSRIGTSTKKPPAASPAVRGKELNSSLALLERRSMAPKEYQCGKEGGTAAAVAAGLTSSSGTCNCDGWVKYGSHTEWSAWLNITTGSVQCSSAVFGTVATDASSRICMCRPRVFQCASEYSSPHQDCELCTTGPQCYCSGFARYGYGDQWTAWRAVSGSVECTSSVFGDPYPGHGKICQCRNLDMLYDNPLSAAPYTTVPTDVDYLLKSTIVVVVVYFLVYSLLAGVRSMNQINGVLPGPAERVLTSGTSAVYLAPMLCALFFAVTKRSDTLTNGNPLYFGYPPSYLEWAAAIASVAFCFQALFHILAEWIVARKDAELRDPRADGRGPPGSAMHAHVGQWLKLWTNLFHISVAIMFGALVTILLGIGLMKEPAELVDTIGVQPLAVGTLCTIVLSIAYFVVYLVLHCLKTRDLSVHMYHPGAQMYSSFGVEVMRLAATAMNFAPMLCILFIGTQIAADWEERPLPSSVQNCMYVCTFAVLVQVVLVLLAPFMSDAELEVTGPRGEVDFVTRNHGAFAIISFVRWAAMTALYAGIFVLCNQLWGMTNQPMTHMLALLSGMYFIAYLMLWVLITARIVRENGLTRAIRILTVVKDTVGFCPMLSALFLGSFARARHITIQTGGTGVPQSYAQDYMCVAILAMVVQLVTTVLSGVYSRSPVGATSQFGQEEKHDTLLPVFLGAFHVALMVLYVAVLVVIFAIFTVSKDNATAAGAWFSI